MAMEGSTKCLQMVVIFFNFIFFLGGIGLLSTGIYVHFEVGEFVELTSVKFLTGSFIIIAAGAIISVVAFLGCCGAFKEHRCMLGTFFALLLVIFGVEVAGTALGYLYRGQIEDNLKSDLNTTITSQYGEPNYKGVTHTLDILQQEEKCCGLNSYEDWRRSRFTNGNHSIVPDSCCKTSDGKYEKGCGMMFNKSDIYTKGCYQKTLDLLKSNLLLISIVGITVAVIQLLGMIFALVLICKIGDQGSYA